MILLEERQHAIKTRLIQRGRVLAAELARDFDVSEDTVRRDLRDLAAAGLCRRVYGGALPISPASGPLTERNLHDPARKAALGRVAASLVCSGDIVLVDAGSTNLHIMRNLSPELRLTVVTNAPSIAAELAGRSNTELIVMGGRVDARVGGCIGARALRDLQAVRADVCLLGTCAASSVTGITVFDAEEAEFKRQMLERSERTVVALSNDKLATTAPFGVAPLSEIADLVVEADAPDAKLDGFERSGLRIHRAASVRPEPALHASALRVQVAGAARPQAALAHR